MPLTTSISRAFISFIRATTSCLGERRASNLQARICETLDPTYTVDTQHGPITFFCPTAMTHYRAETLLTKEPATIQWIDAMEPGSLFWDIGANVGVYTLYAARRGLTVAAFEPAAANYYILCRNIGLNRLDQTVRAYCLAFADKLDLACLNLSSETPGSAIHQFGAAREELDAVDQHRRVAFHQGMVGISLDRYLELFQPEVPHYLKIDVDGIEGLIIAGGNRFFASSRLREVLIEVEDLESQDYLDLVETMRQSGFNLASADATRSDRDSAYRGMQNCIFIRSS